MKKNDNILILGILFIALVVLGIQLLHSANGTEKVKITVDGKVFGTYLLSEDRTVSVNETNIVLITEGTVSMESGSDLCSPSEDQKKWRKYYMSSE